MRCSARGSQRRAGALAEVERLDELQRLRHRRAARRRRTDAADLVSAIVDAQRRALLHRIALEVVERHAARRDRRRRDRIDDRLRDRAPRRSASAPPAAMLRSVAANSGFLSRCPMGSALPPSVKK